MKSMRLSENQKEMSLKLDKEELNLYAVPVSNATCKGCYFDTNSNFCERNMQTDLYCHALYREDRKNIIWKKAVFVDMTDILTNGVDSKQKGKTEMAEEKSNIERFKAITEKMSETYAKKNEDYGDSFSKSLDEFGLVAGVVRIGDKFNRVKNILNVENGFKYKTYKVHDESIKDSLLDMANYCVMCLTWLENK